MCSHITSKYAYGAKKNIRRKMKDATPFVSKMF